VALVETLIAMALTFGFARKLTYTSAAVCSLLIWATAEGVGGPCQRKRTSSPERPAHITRATAAI
jgi:hypothetical protein